MNTKRQTVWLVSMLSIMVVLSAYYLFTNDVDTDMDMASDELMTQDIVMDSIESGDFELEDKESIILEDYNSKGSNMTEDEMLQEVQTQQESGYGYFTNLHLERDEAFSEEYEKLLALTANGDLDAQTEAHDQIYRMDDQLAKLTYLEDLIRRDFAHAIITEEDGNKLKVLVQADAMEKSEAVSIIDMVMKEMNVGPNQVFVEMKN